MLASLGLRSGGSPQGQQAWQGPSGPALLPWACLQLSCLQVTHFSQHECRVARLCRRRLGPACSCLAWCSIHLIKHRCHSNMHMSLHHLALAQAAKGHLFSMLRCMGTFQEALPAGLAAAVLRLLPPLAMLFTGELAVAGSGGGGFTGGSTKPASSMLRLDSVQAGDAAPCRSLMAPCTTACQSHGMR